MPRGLDDAVRTYQLPTDAPSQLSLPQMGLTSNAPIYITPGLGANGGGQLPPLQTGSGSYSLTITYYCKQATIEQSHFPHGLLGPSRRRTVRR